MQLTKATNDAKLKANRLQEEGKQQRSRSLELGGLEIRGSTTVVPQAVNQTITRSKEAPLTTTLPRRTHPLAQRPCGKANRALLRHTR